MAKTSADLIEFLKKKKVYRQFKDNVEENLSGIGGNFNDFMKKLDEEDNVNNGINDGFMWGETDRQEQGFSFWDSIDAEWQREYYNG